MTTRTRTSSDHTTIQLELQLRVIPGPRETLRAETLRVLRGETETLYTIHALFLIPYTLYPIPYALWTETLWDARRTDAMMYSQRLPCRRYRVSRIAYRVSPSLFFILPVRLHRAMRHHDDPGHSLP